MKFNATKLTADLVFANKLACDAVENLPDSGTANMDNVFLRVPRVREIAVLGAIKNAGLYCRRKTEWIGPGYMIVPKIGGQGDKRSKGVEVMTQHLREAGWDTIAFCHND